MQPTNWGIRMDLLNPLLVDLQLDVPAHAEYYRMCKSHDLTCDYSDDMYITRKGWAEKKAIQEYAKNLPRPIAIAIWNYVVREKTTMSDQFLWRE